MNNNYEQELAHLIRQELPELGVEVETTRSLGTVADILVFASSIGLLGGLWKLIELYIQQHKSNSITIKYLTQDGKEVEIQYQNLSKQNLTHFVNENPPIAKEPIILSVKNSDQSTS